jgi:hypothetical protein
MSESWSRGNADAFLKLGAWVEILQRQHREPAERKSSRHALGNALVEALRQTSEHHAKLLSAISALGWFEGKERLEKELPDSSALRQCLQRLRSQEAAWRQEMTALDEANDWSGL